MFYFHPAGIRRIDSPKSIFLTFDDGPNEESTSKVLDLLHRQGASATFFVVAEKAKKQSQFVQKLLKSGHKVGNHSLDHGYRRFFGSTARLKAWVQESQEQLAQILGEEPVGFRPPAGVVTPPLVQALKELKVPLILWRHRFYDSQIPLNSWLLNRSLSRLRGGDIVLLHDAQRSSRVPSFVKNLDLYLAAIKNKGYTFSHLRKDEEL